MLFLGLKKVTQASDISPKIFEQNADIFVDYIYMFFNSFMIEVFYQTETVPYICYANQ